MLKITEILSIYAASLSTIVFLWNMSKATPKFRVDIVHGVEKNDGEYESGIYITVRNPSSHTVYLAGFYLLYPFQKSSIIKTLLHFFKYRNWSKTVGWCHCSLSLYKLNDKCPVAVEAGQSHQVFVPESVLKELLEKSIVNKIKAGVQDQLWRNKYSKPFDYSLSKN